MVKRLNDYVGAVDQDLLTEAQTRIFNVARQRLLAVVRRAVGSLDAWQRSLADIADGLGTLKADTIDLLVRSLPDITEEDFGLRGRRPRTIRGRRFRTRRCGLSVSFARAASLTSPS